MTTVDLTTIRDSTDWHHFEEIDSLNPSNLLEGYISHRRDNLYGAVFIERVNHVSVPQLIIATPKMGYPFDQHGNWHFPKAKQIWSYVKYDGTNACAFWYLDGKGFPYVTVKTRLRPMMLNSRFGPFLDMWNTLMERHPELRELPRHLHMNISYEIYGSSNQHLIHYDTPLALALLFVRKDGYIYPPHAIEALAPYRDHFAAFNARITRDYVQSYKASQITLEDNLVETDNGFTGDEGAVWYLQTEDDIWTPWKCKSPTIEFIHWSAGGLGKLQIRAAVFKAFENWDEPSLANVISILEEDYDPRIVFEHAAQIQTALDVEYAQIYFKQHVMSLYNALEMSILDDKGAVMRALSGHFHRSDMTKVFSTIWNEVTR